MQSRRHRRRELGRELGEHLVRLARIDLDARGLVVDEIAQHALREIQVLIEQRGRRHALRLRHDRRPRLAQVRDIGGKLFARTHPRRWCARYSRLFRRRAARRCSRARTASRSASLSIFCEIPICGSCGRYTSVRPAMLTCVESRAPLVPIGSFTTCTISDCPSNTIFSIGVCGVVRMRHARDARMPDIGDMKERGTLQPDIDERGLHARQHAHDTAEIDVADAPARKRAFDVKLLHGDLLNECDAGFLRCDVDQDFFVHGLFRSRRAPRARVLRFRKGADP